MSREYSDQTYVLQNQKNNENFKTLLSTFRSDYAFFQQRLLQLQAALASAQDNAQEIVNDDYQTTQKLLATFQVYLDTQKASIKLGFITTNKIDDADFAIFKAQAKNLNSLRKMVEQSAPNNNAQPANVSRRSSAAPDDSQSAPNNPQSSNVPIPLSAAADDDQSVAPADRQPAAPAAPAQSSSDALSRLIDDAKNMAYDVSYTKVWLRRTASVLSGLVAFAAATAAICLLMTPGVNIIAAVVAVPVALAALGAFWYMGKPETATMHTHVQAMGTSLPANFTMPVFSTAGLALAGFMGVNAVRKLPIMNPKHEVAARNSQTATINQWTDLLKKKIKALQDSDAKTFLLSVVDKADRMYNEGATAWFYETRTSKTKKAHLILRETAKIMEGDLNNLTVDGILKKTINQTDYTFADLLNAQRNRSTFWKKSSATMDAVGEKVSAKLMSLDEIDRSIAQVVSSDYITQATGA